MDLTTETDLGLVQDLLNERAREIDHLKSELVSKDDLVQAITARLEETVEQLDRLQRQGNSRAGQGASGGAGSIKDVLDSQNALSERVDQSLACWESAGAYFEQILQRLEDFAPGPSRGAGGAGVAPPQDPGPASSAYERMKANLLANAPALPSASPPPLPITSAAIDSGAAAELGTPPVPLDVETASREELAEGVRVRDQYIAQLIQSFRTRDDAILQKVDWNKLQSAPEDLRPQLLALGQRLREKIQREELDHSMERARLAREQARIDLVKQQLEAQIRRLSGPGPAAPAQATDDKKGKDSWLNRLKK